MAECVEKLNTTKGTNTKITFSNSAFQFYPLVFTSVGEWGKQDAEPNRWDLRPELTHSIVVAFQRGMQECIMRC